MATFGYSNRHSQSWPTALISSGAVDGPPALVTGCSPLVSWLWSAADGGRLAMPTWAVSAVEAWLERVVLIWMSRTSLVLTMPNTKIPATIRISGADARAKTPRPAVKREGWRPRWSRKRATAVNSATFTATTSSTAITSTTQ